MNETVRGSLLAIIGTSMWGILGIFTRSLNSFGYSTFEISFVRCLFAGIFLFFFTLICDSNALKITGKSLSICFCYGGIAVVFPFIFSAISLQRTPVAVATVLMFMSPIWVAILGIVVFKDHLTLQTALSIIFCIIGAALVSNLIEATGKPLDFLGVCAGILNSIGVAFQICIPKYYAEKINLQRNTMLVYGFLSAAIILTFLTDFTIIKSSFTSINVSELIFSILGISVLCTMIANAFFIQSAQYINATTATIFSAFEVVVGTAVGYFLYQEHLTPLQIIGAFVIVIAALGPNILNVIKMHTKQSKCLK